MPLTISHVTAKTCLLLPFILQFRASGKDAILVKVINLLKFWSCDGIQIFTGDLVLDLLIGPTLDPFLSKKFLKGFTVRKNILWDPNSLLTVF